MAENCFITEYPFALEWTMDEALLFSATETTKNGFLKSETFPLVPDFGVEYFLEIFPNGNEDDRRGETWIFLNLNLGEEKKIEVEYSFSIASAKWHSKGEESFDEHPGWGEKCCSIQELYDESKNFIVDGKLTVRVEGTVKIEKEKSKWETTMNFKDLWKIGFEDFTIFADKKEIKVHKCVLGSHSPVLAAMFKQLNDEIEIPDFTFEIVEKAIKLCYHRDLILDEFSVDEAILLFKFAEKYSISMLKDNLETYLSENLTTANVCELINCAIDGNALKLQSKCSNFLISCISKKMKIPNMESLDKTFLEKHTFDSILQWTSIACQNRFIELENMVVTVIVGKFYYEWSQLIPPNIRNDDVNPIFRVVFDVHEDRAVWIFTEVDEIMTNSFLTNVILD